MMPLLLAQTATPVINLDALTTVLAPLVAAILLELLRRAWKDRSAAREQLIHSVAHAAYLVTTEAAKLTPNLVDDKVAYALGVFEQALRDRKAAPPTSGELAQAQMTWKALHGKEKLAMPTPLAVVPR